MGTELDSMGLQALKLKAQLGVDMSERSRRLQPYKLTQDFRILWNARILSQARMPFVGAADCVTAFTAISKWVGVIQQNSVRIL